jgi:hypothetical protein
MRFSTHTLVLLLCCTAQRVSSLSAAESWPWSRKPKTPPKSWAPVEVSASGLLENNESSPARAAEQAPVAQADSAEQLQERSLRLQADLIAVRSELKTLTEAQKAQSQMAKEAVSAAEALKLAEEQAAERARVAQAEQILVQGVQAELEAMQRELKELTEPQQAQEPTQPQQAQAQVPEKVAEQDGNETAEQSGNETAEQTTTENPFQDLEAELATKQRELKALAKKHKLQSAIEAKQSELKDITSAQQAKAQAAAQAEAARASQAAQLADMQGAEKARAEKEANRVQELLQEVSTKQRELEEVTKAQAEATEQASKQTLREPTQPGCYMRIPSGCPKRPSTKTNLWRMDTFAQKQGVDKEGCLKRKDTWDSYCGSKDAQIAFVAGETMSS